MRFLLLTAVWISGALARAEVLYCRSSDFKPELSIGQGLQVELNEDGDVIRVYKMTGSEFCDEIAYSAPDVHRMTAKTVIYDLDFPGCATWNEHLAVPLKKRPTWMRFEFTWSDGMSYRRERIFLTCKRS